MVQRMELRESVVVLERDPDLSVADHQRVGLGFAKSAEKETGLLAKGRLLSQCPRPLSGTGRRGTAATTTNFSNT